MPRGFHREAVEVTEKRRKRRLDFSRLIIRAEATGAEVQMLDLTVDTDSGRMDIGSPLAIGPAFGMTDIMAEHGGFTTAIALQGYYSFGISRTIA